VYKKCAHEHQQILSKPQEMMLMDWIGYQANVAKPLDRDSVNSLIFDLSGVVPGINWINWFEQHHPEICASWPGNLDPKCYVLNLPLLFLIPLRPLTHLHTRLLILGTALLSSLTSLMLSLLTPLIFSPAFPPNPLPFAPLCALGRILLIALLSSTPDVLTVTLPNYGLPLVAISPMLIP
jgi:hypothetical protein